MTEGDGGRFAQAGAKLADVYRWDDFVTGGELARTLTHACVLAEPRFALAYRLTETAGTFALVVTAGSLSRAIDLPASDSRPIEPLAAVLRAINELVLDAGFTDQLAIADVDGAPRGDRLRLVLAAPDELAELRAHDYAADCLSDRAVTGAAGPIAALGSPDRVAELRFPEDGSLLGLVAGYVERLAKFAGIVGLTCEARYAQDPGVLTFSLLHKPEGAGGLGLTLRVRYIPELDLQPILDDLNSMLRGTSAQRLYRIAREPHRAEVALLDKAAAAELRRTGDLIEHPARSALRVLATAGFELPALSGQWRHIWWDLDTMLARCCVLARGIADLAATVARDGDACEIAWRVNGRAETTRYGAELGDREKTVVLAMVVRDLNRQLAAAGCAHRFLALTGDPYFYSHRMVLLDRDWLAVVAHIHDALPGCLEGEPIARLAGAFPAADPASVPARLPRLAELVRAEDIQSNDFKCSSRPYDYIDLIEEIARFARVAVEVSPEIARAGEDFVLAVSHRGAPATIQLENQKYANVTPVLEYLNGLLAQRTPVRQLYYFRGGGYSGGLVRATAEEAEQLRIAGYIR